MRKQLTSLADAVPGRPGLPLSPPPPAPRYLALGSPPLAQRPPTPARDRARARGREGPPRDTDLCVAASGATHRSASWRRQVHAGSAQTNTVWAEARLVTGGPRASPLALPPPWRRPRPRRLERRLGRRRDLSVRAEAQRRRSLRGPSLGARGPKPLQRHSRVPRGAPGRGLAASGLGPRSYPPSLPLPSSPRLRRGHREPFQWSSAPALLRRAEQPVRGTAPPSSEGSHATRAQEREGHNVQVLDFSPFGPRGEGGNVCVHFCRAHRGFTGKTGKTGAL